MTILVTASRVDWAELPGAAAAPQATQAKRTAARKAFDVLLRLPVAEPRYCQIDPANGNDSTFAMLLSRMAFHPSRRNPPGPGAPYSKRRTRDPKCIACASKGGRKPFLVDLKQAHCRSPQCSTRPSSSSMPRSGTPVGTTLFVPPSGAPRILPGTGLS